MKILSTSQVARLEKIYENLGEAYDGVAQKLNFSCEGCSDNCCDSYFQHHTYLEWVYLLQGFSELTEDKQAELRCRCDEYEKACESSIAQEKRPQVMCPLCENGLCILYKHRLLVCRTHGVPAVMRFPNGQVRHFMGCFRCQEIVESRFAKNEHAPHVERNPHLAKIIELENEVCNNKRAELPKVKMTIAQMILAGPPQIDEDNE